MGELNLCQIQFTLLTDQGTRFWKGQKVKEKGSLWFQDVSVADRRRQWHPTPVLLPGKSHGRKSLLGCSSWGRTRLSDFTFTFHFHALEKAMATHSSVLAWRVPGTGEPGGLPSMGSHRVGHDQWLSSSSCRYPGPVLWQDVFSVTVVNLWVPAKLISQSMSCDPSTSL